jgi:hypothetical protein
VAPVKRSTIESSHRPRSTSSTLTLSRGTITPSGPNQLARSSGTVQKRHTTSLGAAKVRETKTSRSVTSCPRSSDIIATGNALLRVPLKGGEGAVEPPRFWSTSSRVMSGARFWSRVWQALLTVWGGQGRLRKHR